MPTLLTSWTLVTSIKSGPGFKSRLILVRVPSQNVVDSFRCWCQLFCWTLWKVAGDCRVWEMLISLKCTILRQWGTSKSYPESVFKTGSPLKVNRSFPIITSSFTEIDCFSINPPIDRYTADRQMHKRQRDQLLSLPNSTRQRWKWHIAIVNF